MPFRSICCGLGAGAVDAADLELQAVRQLSNPSSRIRSSTHFIDYAVVDKFVFAEPMEMSSGVLPPGVHKAARQHVF